MTKSETPTLDFVIAQCERETTGITYGFGRPENPNDFTPDGDSSAEELEAHHLACEAWNRGEREGPATEPHSFTARDPDGKLVAHVTTAPWGMGSYPYRDPQVTAWLEEMTAFRDAARAIPDGERYPPASDGVVCALVWQVQALRDRVKDLRTSRRAWIDAATKVLGPDWNGGPDDLAKALNRIRLDADMENTIDRNTGLVDEDES